MFSFHKKSSFPFSETILTPNFFYYVSDEKDFKVVALFVMLMA